MKKEKEKETPPIIYEEVCRYDPYTYWLLHRAFEEEGRKVEIGDKVVPTKWAIQNGVCKPEDKGIVVGFGRGPFLIRVRKIGLKTPATYWAGFWRKAE